MRITRSAQSKEQKVEMSEDPLKTVQSKKSEHPYHIRMKKRYLLECSQTLRLFPDLDNRSVAKFTKPTLINTLNRHFQDLKEVYRMLISGEFPGAAPETPIDFTTDTDTSMKLESPIPAHLPKLPNVAPPKCAHEMKKKSSHKVLQNTVTLSPLVPPDPPKVLDYKEELKYRKKFYTGRALHVSDDLSSSAKKKLLTHIKKEYYQWLTEFINGILSKFGTFKELKQQYVQGIKPQFDLKVVHEVCEHLTRFMNITVQTEREKLYFLTDNRKRKIRHDILQKFIILQNHYDLFHSTRDAFEQVFDTCVKRITIAALTGTVEKQMLRSIQFYSRRNGANTS